MKKYLSAWRYCWQGCLCLLLLLCLSVQFCSCSALCLVVPSEADLDLDGYELVFYDEFEGDCLDESVWESRLEGVRRGGFNHSDQIAVADGNLVLTAEYKESEYGEGWHTAMIQLRELYTYGLMWTESEYVFYVNGREIGRSSFAAGVSRVPEYVIVSLEVDDVIDRDPSETETFLVDYVKIYQIPS